MTKLDKKALNELKLVQARFYRTFLASDVSWNNVLQTYCALSYLLSNRAKMQRLAKRYGKNPVRFCEKIIGRGWFEPPKGASTRQVQTMLKASPSIIDFLSVPQGVEDANAKQFIKIFNTLAARPAGRKRAEVYAKAMALYQSGISLHRICIDLVPTYKDMSAPERSAKRKAMRAGVSRLRKAMNAAQRQTKSRL